MIKTLEHQVIALAALTQAIHQVQQIAHHGNFEVVAFETLVNSLLQMDPPDMQSVYGDLEQLRDGLRILESQLSGHAAVDTELARYATTLVFLERKLMASPHVITTLRAGLEGMQVKAAHFGLNHETVTSGLAEVYQNTLSNLKPQIMVHGTRRFLSSPANADRIRCLLLAATRAVVLWRQCGGTRWKLVWERSAIRKEAQRLLSSLDNRPTPEAN